MSTSSMSRWSISTSARFLAWTSAQSCVAPFPRPFPSQAGALAISMGRRRSWTRPSGCTSASRTRLLPLSWRQPLPVSCSPMPTTRRSRPRIRQSGVSSAAGSMLLASPISSHRAPSMCSATSPASPWGQTPASRSSLHAVSVWRAFLPPTSSSIRSAATSASTLHARTAS